MRIIILILFLIVSSMSAVAQTARQIDTIAYTTLGNHIPSFLRNSAFKDSTDCIREMTFSFVDNESLVDQEITAIEILIEGVTIGSIKPKDIEAIIVSDDGFTTCSTDWLTVDSPGAATGSFSINAHLISFADDSYNPDDELTFSIVVRRNTSDDVANPACGTEEAYVDRWRMVIHYNTDDADDDGYRYGSEDCDDGNNQVNPGTREYCGNGIDDNCNGVVDELPLINHVSGIAKNVYSLRSVDTCDQLVVMDGTNWIVNGGLPVSIGTRMPPIVAESLTIVSGGHLLTGGAGCVSDPPFQDGCTGDHIEVETFEVQLGATAEIGPNTLIGEGCLFCLSF